MSCRQGSARSVHVLIIGLVQGVCYRVWTREQAVSLGLTGWVANRREGGVEAVFSGDGDGVAEMLRRCQNGPPGARVEEVRIVKEGAAALSGFEIRTDR